MTSGAKSNLELLWSFRGKPNQDAIKEALFRVGLQDVGNKKVGEFSLGMRHRLGIVNSLCASDYNELLTDFLELQSLTGCAIIELDPRRCIAWVLLVNG